MLHYQRHALCDLWEVCYIQFRKDGISLIQHLEDIFNKHLRPILENHFGYRFYELNIITTRGFKSFIYC